MTSVAVTTPVDSRPAPDAGRGPGTSRRTDLRLVSVLVVLLVLTQRLGLPVGDSYVSLAVPIAYAFAVVLATRRLLVVSWLRAGLFVLAASACLLTTAAVSSSGTTRQMSMSSLGLLLILYLPLVLRLGGPNGAAALTRAGRTFVWTMLALSAIGLVQLTAQFTGLWQWQDYLQKLVGDTYIVPNYNFSNYLYYGSGLYKASAFVMLEPSFLSQFCALAILIGIMLRIRAWQLLLLAGGMASAVSGTGIILLACGAVLLLLRAPRRLRPGYVVAALVVVPIVAVSPVGPLLLDRQDEVGTAGTSGYARFNAPYTEAWKGLEADPTRFWIGAGPGSVDRLIPGSRVGVNGADVVYSVVPKLVFEYGVIAGGLFTIFLLATLLYRSPLRVVPGSLVVMVFLLSGALLQPQTAVLAWLLAGAGLAGPPAVTAGSRGPNAVWG